MGHDERFWLENPGDLLARFDIFPRPEDTWEQKLNSITRLIILITVILVVLKWQHWLTFLVISLILVIFVYLLKQSGNQHYYVQGVDIMEHFNEGNNFKYYKTRSSRQEGRIARAPPRRLKQPDPPRHGPVDLDEQVGQGFTHFVMPGESIHEHAPPQASRPVERPAPQSIPRRRRKTAYEHAKAAWLEDVDEDEVARDRQNLISSIM